MPMRSTPNTLSTGIEEGICISTMGLVEDGLSYVSTCGTVNIGPEVVSIMVTWAHQDSKLPPSGLSVIASSGNVEFTSSNSPRLTVP